MMTPTIMAKRIINPTKQELSNLYWDQSLTLAEVGSCFGVTGKCIGQYLDCLGIPKRSSSEAHKLTYKRGRCKLPKNMQRENSPSWKGGRYINRGYVFVTIYEDNPYYCMGMRNTGIGKRILEHRLIMAQELGRPLLRSETVHHLNGIKGDNRPENLKLVSRASHLIYSELCARCPLRKEIRLLRWQIKELTAQIQGRLLLPDGDKDHQ